MVEYVTYMKYLDSPWCSGTMWDLYPASPKKAPLSQTRLLFLLLLLVVHGGRDAVENWFIGGPAAAVFRVQVTSFSRP